MKTLFSVALLLLVLSGCAGLKSELPPAPAAEVLLQRLSESAGRWQQLDTAAKVGVERGGKYLSTQQFILLERPDRIRVDVLSLFNQLAMQLTHAQGELEVLLNTSVPGQYYRGPATDELLARFTRLPLGADVLVRLLLHDPPFSEHQGRVVEMTEDGYLLRLTSAKQEQNFLFDQQLQLRRALYLRNGQTLLRVEYAKFDRVNRFPQRIVIEMPQEKTKLTVKLSDVRLNSPAPAGRFQLSPPANAVPLDLLGLNGVTEGS